jgi:hypothetical protein
MASKLNHGKIKESSQKFVSRRMLEGQTGDLSTNMQGSFGKQFDGCQGLPSTS